MPIETINYLLALGTIAMQAAAIALVAVYLYRNRWPLCGRIVSYLERWGMWHTFVLSVLGVVLTLFYSEVIGYVPCGLCWVVRIFLYPQALLLGMALWKKDTALADYSIALSVLGAIVALYTHYLQMGGNALLPCPASGVSDCTKRFVFEFGYITMPMMGFSLLMLMAILMFYVRTGSRQRTP